MYVIHAPKSPVNALNLICLCLYFTTDISVNLLFVGFNYSCVATLELEVRNSDFGFLE